MKKRQTPMSTASTTAITPPPSCPRQLTSPCLLRRPSSNGLSRRFQSRSCSLDSLDPSHDKIRGKKGKDWLYIALSYGYLISRLMRGGLTRKYVQQEESGVFSVGLKNFSRKKGLLCIYLSENPDSFKNTRMDIFLFIFPWSLSSGI